MSQRGDIEKILERFRLPVQEEMRVLRALVKEARNEPDGTISDLALSNIVSAVDNLDGSRNCIARFLEALDP